MNELRAYLPETRAEHDICFEESKIPHRWEHPGHGLEAERIVIVTQLYYKVEAVAAAVRHQLVEFVKAGYWHTLDLKPSQAMTDVYNLRGCLMILDNSSIDLAEALARQLEGRG